MDLMNSKTVTLTSSRLSKRSLILANLRPLAASGRVDPAVLRRLSRATLVDLTIGLPPNCLPGRVFAFLVSYSLHLSFSCLIHSRSALRRRE